MTALALVVAAALQFDSTAAIRGTASSTLDDRPLAGVMISVPAAHKFVVTDSAGTFWLGGLPSGDQQIRVSYAGRRTTEYAFTLHSRHTTRIVVLLDVDAVELDPVVVEAQHPNAWRDLAGFYERKKWYNDIARFFTRAEIEGAHAPTISAILARDGITTQCGQGCLPTRLYRGTNCVVPVSVDGVPFQERDYNQISINDVAGIEIYQGNPPAALGMGMAVTADYSLGEGGQRTLRSCGAVLIWTR